jgi:cysteine synthase A
VIDAMCKVPDALSLAAMHYLVQRFSRRVGGSSGTNLIGALLVAQRRVAIGGSGSVAAILCDGGERYAGTYYDPTWLSAQGFEMTELIATVADRAERGLTLPGDLPTAEL